MVLAISVACLVQVSMAQYIAETENLLPRHFPTKQKFALQPPARTINLTYHNGPVIPIAYVVAIFWGPSFGTNGSDHNVATSLTSYIDGNTSGAAGYGQTSEFNVITQYYQTPPTTYISKSRFGTNSSSLFDSSAPPTNVTDAAVQAEVLKMTGNNPRTDTIYEVFLPSTSYSSDGTATSCGGPRLTYCAYHGNFSHGSSDVKYASMPYPSCGGCQTSGWTVSQNFEHFISHETREAVTDPDGTAWWDRTGNEADDKCAWSPTPFTDSSTGTNVDGSAFAYQYEWSNANSGCVKTR
jgi:hypothetical protein